MGLLCVWLILIIGPRLIFGYVVISYNLYGFLFDFAMFLFDFKRRPSPPIFGYLMISCGFAMFSVDFNCRPSPDLRLSYDLLWFCIGVPMVLLCFSLVLIVGPRPDLRLSHDFPWISSRGIPKHSPQVCPNYSGSCWRPFTQASLKSGLSIPKMMSRSMPKLQ